MAYYLYIIPYIYFISFFLLTSNTNELDRPDERTMFPNLQLQQELGRGAEGCVFLAKHKRSDSAREQTVAVKVIDKRRRSASLDLFNSLHHPHIMPCLAIEENGDKLAVVMKRAKGGDLHSFIQRNGALDVVTAHKLFGQLVSAVAHIHELGLVHRDIKPENILLNGKHDHIWLCDFGFAEVTPVEIPQKVDSPSSSSTLTHEAEDKGDKRVRCTLHYAAPEVLIANNDSLVSMPAVDVWSCAVVLAFMLTGTLPFNEASDYDTYHKITSGSATLPEWILNDELLMDLFGKLFQRNPALRINAKSIEEHQWLLNKAEDKKSSLDDSQPGSRKRKPTARVRSGIISTPRRNRLMRSLQSISEE